MYEIKLNNTYILSFVSIVFVSLLFNLFVRNEVDFQFITLDINSVRNVVLQGKREVIGNVMFSRIKQYILLLILLKAFGGKRVIDIILISLGGVFGFILSAQIYYVGIGGILILLAYVLPHYIIYIIGLCYIHKFGMFELGANDNFPKIMWFTIILAIGVILECVFMTIFLKNFYQYMVS